MIRFHYQNISLDEVDKKFFAEVLDYAISLHLPAKSSELIAIDLMVLNDYEIQKMNKLHKSRDCPTDVLAFYDGEDDEDGSSIHLGDVAISIDTAKREAIDRDINTLDELLLYAVHGTLHLLGFRDSSDEEKQAMREAEFQVLQKFKITPSWD